MTVEGTPLQARALWLGQELNWSGNVEAVATRFAVSGRGARTVAHSTSHDFQEKLWVCCMLGYDHLGDWGEEEGQGSSVLFSELQTI